MLYAILCYDSEELVCSWTKEEDDAAVASLASVQDKLRQQGRLGPVARLLPTTTATTIRHGKDPVVLDGPFAETKEQLLGFFIVDCESLEQAIETGKDLARASVTGGVYEVRPLRNVSARERRLMNDVIDRAWLDTALRAARPRALSALLRYFRVLDLAEEAFQEACLAAVKKWPLNGPPRDAAAWLIFVGRNSGIDRARRRSKEGALLDADQVSDLEDAPAQLAEQLDDAPYRDDILRLLFICCHPELPAIQQIALALRLVSGLTVAQIARAFLVSETAMEQRITRAKKRVTEAHVPYETPGAQERADRIAAVAAVTYLIFNEGYSSTGSEAQVRAPLGDEAIRLARLLLRMYPDEPSLMGLVALMLIQHSRAPARFDADGNLVLLEDQDRGLWNRELITEGLAVLDKALRHRRPDTYQIQAAIAALHARAARAADTDWTQIERLYATLEHLQPSPVITLNRAVAISKVRGPAEALDVIEPLAPALSSYFYFFGVKGALLLQLRRHREARAAFDRAIALASTAAEAAHIRMQLDRLLKESSATP